MGSTTTEDNFCTVEIKSRLDFSFVTIYSLKQIIVFHFFSLFISLIKNNQPLKIDRRQLWLSLSINKFLIFINHILLCPFYVTNTLYFYI